MNIVGEILAFSAAQPVWQQDALRRLAAKASLSQADIQELAALAMFEAGIGTAPATVAKPLSAQDLALTHAPGNVVVLESIHSVKNVNALVDGQRLEFEPIGLTAVYGENGTGKTGYTRILRKACRARKAPEILANVMGHAAGPAAAAFSIRVGSAATTVVPWAAGQQPPSALARFCVFDRECEKGFIDEQGEATFFPAGLDVFQRLAQVVEAVKKAIEAEETAIPSEDLSELMRSVAGYKPSADFLGAIRADLADADYANLAKWLQPLLVEPADLAQLATAKTTLASAADPAGRAKELRTLAASIGTTREAAVQVSAILGATGMAQLRQAWDLAGTTRAAAEAAERDAFSGSEATGLGGEVWRELYRAAEKYATTAFQPDRPFPDATGDARCPFCLQTIMPDAKARLERFRAFMSGEARGRADQARKAFEVLVAGVTKAAVTATDPVVLEKLTSVLVDQSKDAVAALRDIPRVVGELKRLIPAVSEAQDWAQLPAFPEEGLKLIPGIETLLEEKAQEVERLADPTALAALKATIASLEARKALTDSSNRVGTAIARLRTSAALRRCHAKLKTRKITDEGKALTDKVLTGGLQAAFEQEMTTLDAARRIQASVGPRGEKGRTVYGLVLDNAVAQPKTSSVLSEGEQRVVALAYFLAEVQLAPATVGVIFDDPVCSLDHRWARRIARRLVDLARDRQVIVFTHNISFLLELERFAAELAIPMGRRYVTRRPEGPGVCDHVTAPWEKLSIGTRITRFKQEQSRLKAFHDADADSAEYKLGATRLCSELRAGWERAVEEVVLNGVVERFGPAVKTQSLNGVVMDDSVFKAVYDAMTSLSMETEAHDSAAEAITEVMNPAKLLAEITKLEKFVKDQTKRKNDTIEARKALTKPPAVPVPSPASGGTDPAR